MVRADGAGTKTPIQKSRLLFCTLLRESIKIPGLCRRMSVAVVGLVCSDQLS